MTATPMRSQVTTDSIALAHLGQKVIAVERHPIIFALLRDGLARAAVDPETMEVVSRIRLIHADAATCLAEEAGNWNLDAVYYDPMYPEKRKRSARPPKEMQALQALVGEDGDEQEVVDAALAAAPRVVVKRPLSAPPVGTGVSREVKGKMVRFDVYLKPQ